MVNNIMVYDPQLLSNKERKKYQQMNTSECSVDVTCKSVADLS